MDIGSSLFQRDYCSNRVLNNSTASRPARKSKISLLSAGSNNKFDPHHDALLAARFECKLFDGRMGPQCDLIDNSVYDPFLSRLSLGEYAAAIASPDPATFSKWLDLPGPPALRDLSGRGRYGKSTLTQQQDKRVNEHNLHSVRVAEILDRFIFRGCPWILERPGVPDSQVSVLALDEFAALLGLTGVARTDGVQCPFGALSPRPTTWVHWAVYMSDMPSVCPHEMRTWFNQTDGSAIARRHRLFFCRCYLRSCPSSAIADVTLDAFRRTRSVRFHRGGSLSGSDETLPRC